MGVLQYFLLYPNELVKVRVAAVSSFIKKKLQIVAQVTKCIL